MAESFKPHRVDFFLPPSPSPYQHFDDDYWKNRMAEMNARDRAAMRESFAEQARRESSRQMAEIFSRASKSAAAPEPRK